jgi:thiol-disulfide isomerase/thioredoxin
MNQDNKNSLKINYWFLRAVFAVILVSATVTIFFSLKTNSLTNQKMAAAAEAKRPANLEATVITDSKCPDCFDINKVIGQLEKLNVKITNKNFIERTSDEGKTLIEKYQIKKIPTFILTGEINKGDELKNALAKVGVAQNDAFVYELSGGPYVTTAIGEIKGRTNADYRYYLRDVL